MGRERRAQTVELRYELRNENSCSGQILRRRSNFKMSGQHSAKFVNHPFSRPIQSQDEAGGSGERSEPKSLNKF
jgi:hypothetical protein